MANEISFAVTLKATKGFLDIQKAVAQSITLSASAPNASSGTQSVGFAAHEAIPLGDISTNGIAFFRNLDATNYVDIGLDVAATFCPLIRLLPGECGAVRLTPGAVPYAQAHTAAVVLERLILDA